jgi:hypothetical protein
VTWPFPHLAELVRVAADDRRRPAPPSPVDGLHRLARARDRAEADAIHDELAGRRWGDLARRSLAIAIAEIGKGERGGDNRGPDVERYIAPARPPQNWCAGFVGWCYEQAAAELGIALPFQRSLGAKRLGRNVGAVGRTFTDPALAKPGDLMVFSRGAKGSWMGHVAMVEDIGKPAGMLSVVYTVEGNSGPKVRRRVRDTGPLGRFAFFASLRR